MRHMTVYVCLSVCQLFKACADGHVKDIEDLINSDDSLQIGIAKNAVRTTHIHANTHTVVP